MQDVSNLVETFINDKYGGRPSERFNNILEQSNKYNNTPGGGVHSGSSMKMLEQQAGFGGYEYETPTRQPSYGYPQQTDGQYLSPYQMQQMGMPTHEHGKRGIESLPMEIQESLKTTPIDMTTFQPPQDNRQNHFIENTRTDLLQHTPNPWNPTQQQVREGQQYSQNNIIPQGLPINNNYHVQPQNPTGINQNELISLIESVFDRKFQTPPEPNNNNTISLVINGEKQNGVIRQKTNGVIYFIFNNNTSAVELTPSSIKKIKKT